MLGVKATLAAQGCVVPYQGFALNIFVLIVHRGGREFECWPDWWSSDLIAYDSGWCCCARWLRERPQGFQRGLADVSFERFALPPAEQRNVVLGDAALRERNCPCRPHCVAGYCLRPSVVEKINVERASGGLEGACNAGLGTRPSGSGRKQWEFGATAAELVCRSDCELVLGQQ
jgi:hypothetical protein